MLRPPQPLPSPSPPPAPRAKPAATPAPVRRVRGGQRRPGTPAGVGGAGLGRQPAGRGLAEPLAGGAGPGASGVLSRILQEVVRDAAPPLMRRRRRSPPATASARAYVYVRQSSPSRSSTIARAGATSTPWSSAPSRWAGAPSGSTSSTPTWGSPARTAAARASRSWWPRSRSGSVGLVLAYEASRLARNNADWYALLDLAARAWARSSPTPTGSTTRAATTTGCCSGCGACSARPSCTCCGCAWTPGGCARSSAGTYRQHLPTGLVRLPDGRVVKDPDQQVQRALALVFARFAALGTCQKVLRSLRDDGLLLPRRQTGGPEPGELLWKPPTERGPVRDPAQPGLRRGLRLRRGTAATPSGRPGQPRRRRPPAAGGVAGDPAATPTLPTCPGRSSWRTRRAWPTTPAASPGAARGAPRAGRPCWRGWSSAGAAAGRCASPTAPGRRYVCAALSRRVRRPPTCLHVDGAAASTRRWSTAFFAALAPAELDLLDEVLAAQQADRARLAQQHADQVAPGRVRGPSSTRTGSPHQPAGRNSCSARRRTCRRSPTR